MGEKIHGVLLPTYHKFVERLLRGEKDVFVKFGRLAKLSRGHRLVLYDSTLHEIVGEGKIDKVEYAEPEVIWNKYGSRIFLEPDELEDYVARSPLGPRSLKRRIMTALVLKDIHRYKEPKKPPKRVTPSGYYLRN